jgi:hypothetical protein
MIIYVGNWNFRNLKQIVDSTCHHLFLHNLKVHDPFSGREYTWYEKVTHASSGRQTNATTSAVSSAHKIDFRSI